MHDLRRMINPLKVSRKAVKQIKKHLEEIHQYTPPMDELIAKELNITLEEANFKRKTGIEHY